MKQINDTLKTSVSWQTSTKTEKEEKRIHKLTVSPGLSWWRSGKESTCSTEDKGSILGREDPLEKESGNRLQYSCLGNSMDSEAWPAAPHGIAKSWI